MGFQGIKGEGDIYSSRRFLSLLQWSLGFEISHEKYTEYSTATSVFEGCALLPTG